MQNTISATSLVLSEAQTIILSIIRNNPDSSYDNNITRTKMANATVYDEGLLDVETMYTSLTGLNIARTTSTLSMISSLLIIAMIKRSSAGFSIVYHRLMFGMSVCDAISSFAMALTTLPMPKEMIYTQFEGSHIGTFGTCAAQSFAQNGGTLGTVLYNIALSVHYLHSVRSSRATMSKWVELLLHALCLAVPVSIIAAGASLDTTNPTPYLPWCGTFVSYPYWCLMDENTECIRGRNAGVKKFITSPLFGSMIFIVIVLMGITVYCVYQNEKLVKMYSDIYKFKRGNRTNDQDEIRLKNSKKTFKVSKETSIQAAAYVIALILSQSGIFLRGSAPQLIQKSSALQIYHLITRPLQGFFNLVVFVGERVHSHKEGHPDVSTCRAIYQIVVIPQQTPFHFNHISMVEMDRCFKEKCNSESKVDIDKISAQIEFPLDLTKFDHDVFQEPTQSRGSRSHADFLSDNDPSIAVSDSEKFTRTPEHKNRKEFYANVRAGFDFDKEDEGQGNRH